MKAVLSWLWDRKWLILFALGTLAAFLFVDHFAELIYSAFKLTIVVVLGSMILHWFFPETLHKYINEGQFLTDFNTADAKHKLWIVISVIGIIFIVSALCFHAA